MAFGGIKGTLSGNGPSIGTSNAITGSVAVAVGDLVFVAFMQQTNLTATAATDNLGNTYSATNAGSDPGSLTGRAFWSLVTNAGTLTAISVAATSSTLDYVGVAAVIEGVFASSPLDANPANIVNDLTSPFVCPATGTLSQADEVIMSWAAYQGGGDDWAADSPNLKAVRTQESNRSAIIGYQLVSSTSSVAPAFSHANATSIDVLGTSSFKKASLDAAFTGTVTATFSQTGVVESASVLAGTTPIAFDQSGDFVAGSAGDVSFTGTIGIVFGQTGALKGGAGAAGTTTLVFAQTGAFAATAKFAGPSVIAFGQTGGLSATTGFAGTTPIVFGQTGDFTAQAAPTILIRHGGGDRKDYQTRQQESREELQRIIDQAWRIANGEIDPVTLEVIPPPPPPDYSLVQDALAAQAINEDQQRIEAFISAQEQMMEDEAVAVLLLA